MRLYQLPLLGLLLILPLCAASCGESVAAPLPPAVNAPTATSTLAEGLRFQVTYDEKITDSFTGRVYLMFNRFRLEPRFGPPWFAGQPMFALDVEDWKPNTPLIFDKNAIGYPGPYPATIDARTYGVQAIMRVNKTSHTIGQGTGTGYSEVKRQAFDPSEDKVVDLRINKIVGGKTFRDSPRVKLAEMRSELLSKFHGRDVFMSAAVVLPENYDPRSARKYPAYYFITGFGGDHHGVSWMNGMMWGKSEHNDQLVRIVLDPLCYGGHHVFADSENNGPRARTLVEEFIPALERAYPIVSEPSGRFLGGISSGGWSSLWLQLNYPDFFGGVWSLAPDPIDFRDFQQIDLYEPEANMFVDSDGQERPLARRQEGNVMYRDFARMEVVWGEGGQLRSFEWVFSPRGDDGLPMPLFDRNTGVIDPKVAAAWRNYDIRLLLEENWPTLKDKLRGKVHIFVGDADTYFLEGAVVLTKRALEVLESDAVVEIVPGADHRTIVMPDLIHRIDREMVEAFDAGKS